jgi:hypothetical protein
MTCVVGLVSESGYGYIGADSYAGDANGLYSLTATPKVAKIGSMLIGFAGDFGQGERAIASLKRSQSLKTFATTIRRLDLNDVELLVIENGRIYEVCQGAIIETLSRRGRNYGAVGTGAHRTRSPVRRRHRQVQRDPSPTSQRSPLCLSSFAVPRPRN